MGVSTIEQTQAGRLPVGNGSGSELIAPSRAMRGTQISAIVVCPRRESDCGPAYETTVASLRERAGLPCEVVVVPPQFDAGGDFAPLAPPHPAVRMASFPSSEGTVQALNRAAAQVVGRYLLFIPAGSTLAEDWDGTYLAPLLSLPQVLGIRWLCLHRGAVAQLECETADAFLPWQGMALPRALFRDLGGFDPQFEDAGCAIDLCWRARDRGIRLTAPGDESPVVTASAEVYAPTDRAAFRRDLVRLARKYPGRVELPEELAEGKGGVEVRECEGVGVEGQGGMRETAERRRRRELPQWVRSPHRQRPVKDGERILLHHEIGLGDILLALTAAQALKDQNPNCWITFATAPRYFDLPVHSPYVDRVVSTRDVRSGDFDREVDFEGREKFDFVPGEGDRERLDLIAEIVGYTPQVRRPIYKVTPQERETVRRSFKPWNVGDDAERIGIVLSASSPFRSRSAAATAALVRDLLRERPRAHLFLLDNDDACLRQVEEAWNGTLTPVPSPAGKQPSAGEGRTVFPVPGFADKGPSAGGESNEDGPPEGGTTSPAVHGRGGHIFSAPGFGSHRLAVRHESSVLSPSPTSRPADSERVREEGTKGEGRGEGAVDATFAADSFGVRTHPRITSLCGELTIAELAALLEQLDLLITPDTGTMHLAAAFETPQITFFSEIHPQVRVSHYANVVPRVRAELCVHWPCGYGGQCKTNQCCINALTYEDVQHDIERLLRVSLERRALRDRQLAEEVARHTLVTHCSPVLLERYAGMGDIFFALTVAAALKRKNPEAEIDFLTSPDHAEWVRWFPFLRKVITEAPRESYALKANLQSIDTMDGVDRVEVMAAKLGLIGCAGEDSPYLADIAAFVPPPDLPPALRTEMERRLREETARSGSNESLPLLAFAPFCGGRTASRSWSITQVRGFLTLAAEHYRVVFLDRNRVVEIPDQPNLLRLDGAVNAAQAVALIGFCDRFVGVDSGLLYAAVCFNVPAVGLFSHINPLSRLGRGRNSIAIRATGLDCIPCGDFDGTPACAGSSHYVGCVKALTPAAAWKAVKAVSPGPVQVWTTPVTAGKIHRPPRIRPALTFVVPWLQPAGGERHLQHLCEGLGGEFDIHIAVTSPESSHSVDSVFAPWPVLNLEGDLRTRTRRLAAHFDGAKPQTIIFYNNCLTLDALQRSVHRPEKIFALIHTQFEHEADLTTHPMSFLVNRFICVSETARDALRQRSCIAPDRIIVIRNGVDAARFEDVPHLRRQLGYGPEDFVLGNVGRISDGKNLSLIVEAAAMLPTSVKVLLVGWGNEVELCQRNARELGIKDRLRIVEPTPHVAPYLRSMNAFALPTDIEGAVPYAVMEAMAADVPVLCTPVADIPLLFRDGESLLFIAKHPESIAAKVRILKEHPDLCRELAGHARSIVQSRLSADRMLDEYLTLIVSDGV